MQRFQVLRTGFDIRRLCQRTHFRIRGQEGIKLPFSLPLSLSLSSVSNLWRELIDTSNFADINCYQDSAMHCFSSLNMSNVGLSPLALYRWEFLPRGYLLFWTMVSFFFFFSQSRWRCKEFSFDFIEFLIVFVVYFFVMAWFARGSKDKRAVPFG